MQQVIGRAKYESTAQATVWLIWIAIAVLWGLARRRRLEPRRQQWSAGLQKLRDGYFCFRDGVAFNAGERVAYEPRGFVRESFKAYPSRDGR